MYTVKFTRSAAFRGRLRWYLWLKQRLNFVSAWPSHVFVENGTLSRTQDTIFEEYLKTFFYVLIFKTPDNLLIYMIEYISTLYEEQIRWTFSNSLIGGCVCSNPRILFLRRLSFIPSLNLFQNLLCYPSIFAC